jgi:hypothetical protein
LSDKDIYSGFPPENQPSQKVLVVILFWSLFESLMDKLCSDGSRFLPESVKQDILKRYGSIGLRINKLYPVLFSASLKDDLRFIGKEGVYDFLSEVQKKRNEFIHGKSEVINDDIVNRTILNIRTVQEAWISLYNLRCARKPATLNVPS